MSYSPSPHSGMLLDEDDDDADEQLLSLLSLDTDRTERGLSSPLPNGGLVADIPSPTVTSEWQN